MQRVASLIVLLCIAAPVAAQQAQRAPIPAAQAVTEAKALIAEVYKKEYAAARTPQQYQALARKLREDALQTQDDKVSRYALLQVAGKVAAKSGDAELASYVAASLRQFYDVDASLVEAEILEEMAAHLTDPAMHYFFGQAAERLAAVLRRQGHWTAAIKIAKAAEGSARKNRDPDLAKMWGERAEEFRKLEQVDALLQAAMTRLDESPVDPKANRTAGRIHFFARKDPWTGMPYLALGEPSLQQRLAVKEIARSFTAAERMEAADGWREVAKEYEGAERKTILRFAMDHYAEAEQGLEGLQRQRARKAWNDLFAEAMPDRFLLSELKPTVYENGWGKDGPFMLAVVNGRSFGHSLWLHPPDDGAARAVFDLPCRCKYIVGAYGFRDMNDRPHNPSVFRLLSDGQELFKSPERQDSGTAFPFKVELKNVLQLEFRVECQGFAGANQAFWFTPMLQK